MTDIIERLKTALADRYAIERELGSGGMATVYLAQDLKHHRPVAVKVLRPELAAVLGAERFLKEIEVTANLQHPHILPLFDSGQAGGRADGQTGEFLYYVMPYVEGETLREKLNREIQLGVDEAVRITTEVAGALDSAHRHNVIHRDIKPENILLRDGHAVVADFGIALAVSSAGGERLTEMGLSLGTPAYMSPEQVAGDREIDSRSDIYSLACVLYEMLAGEPPFTGPTPRVVLARQVADPVPPITTVRSSVSRPVAAAIMKALGKSPADRFDTIAQFAEALASSAEERVDGTKSIVVLPFANLSPDPDNEYFSDGLTEEIIADLSKLKLLRVISRNSAIQLKGTDKDTKTIGRELDVQYVLEGTVRKAGDRLRITAQLIDAENDAHLWAEKYTGTLEDVFDMQEQVSRSIVDALELQLTPEEERHIAERPIEDVQAYQCYLRARQETWLFTKDALDRAVQYLQRGLDIIGPNAMLFAGMGYAYLQYVNIGLEQEEYLDRAEEYARKALELDPESAEGHLVLGFANMSFRAHLVKAFSHFRHALAVNPDDAHVLSWFIVGHTIVGKTADARFLAQRLIHVDPLTPMSRVLPGLLEFMEGRFDRAVEAGAEWFRMEPENPAAQFFYAIFLAYAQRFEELCTLVDENVRPDWNDVFSQISLLLKAAVEGDTTRMEQLASGDIVRTWRRDPQFSWFVASIYALAGSKDEALDWLANTVDRGFINYAMLAQHDPFLTRLSGDPRFEEITARAKLEWEQFEA